METISAGELAGELLNSLIKILRRVYLCRESAAQLRRSVETLLPIITEIRFSGLEISQNRQKQLSDLAKLLRLGLDLARQVAASSRFNVYRSVQLARKMEKVGGEIDRWVQREMPVQILADVKDMLMNGEVVGVCGIGGSGKTTLARKICWDAEIRNYFGEKIFFETVSQFPNLEALKLKLWEHISGNMVTDPYKQIPQWQTDLKPRAKQPALIVLDDVWLQTELEELVLRVPCCKTLVVSRVKFPAIINSTYELELLEEDESLSLFCCSAFGQESVPDTADKNLVKQVAAECKGLPLALKVIGASLRDQPPKIWISAKNRLSRGEAISESHEIKLLERMATSIECLKGKVKECFLDLGCFPEDKKIPLDVLINLWMEMHDLDEEDAFAILVELSNRNLLTLVKDTQNKAGDLYSSYCELSITQHDVLRDLALYMNNREPLKRRKRLIMARREGRLPKDWERDYDQPFEAQIVSIHTGEMKELDWPPINFPKAEVLMINFSAETYFLPPFLNTLPNLKTLILINYSSSSAALENISFFTAINNLQSLWLEKITLPPLPLTTLPLHNLKKISLVLCELKTSFQDSIVDLRTAFPLLSHITIDHSMDLTELPSSICELRSLQNLSVSNCHDLRELPAEVGKLESLRMLRVYACPALKKLPTSICRLKKLKYLDISQCVSLRDLPAELGELSGLEKIDMRECWQLRDIPRSFRGRDSLLHVVCDEDMALMWKEGGKDMRQLRVQVEEEPFDLDWLVE